jgi:predicted PurR-regulated permease PerM
MTLQRQIGFWLVSLIVFVLVLVLLRDVLLPFVAALALAYLLDPLADRLERWGLSRLAATIVILVVFLLIFVLALVLLAPCSGSSSPASSRGCRLMRPNSRRWRWSRAARGWNVSVGRNSPRTRAIRSAISSARRRNGSAACCNRSGPAAPRSSACSRFWC